MDGISYFQIDYTIEEAEKNGHEDMIRRPVFCPKTKCSECKRLLSIFCDEDGGITLLCREKKHEDIPEA